MNINRISILWHYLRCKKRSFSSRQALEKWQNKQFKKFKKKVLPNSPFYRPLTDKQLHQFPLVNKAITMQNFDDINTVGLQKKPALDMAIKAEQDRNFNPSLNGITVGLSSGTSGSRGLFVASKKERTIWSGTILAKLLPKALWKHQKIAFFLRANSNLYQTVQSRFIQFEFFDLLINMQQHIKKLNRYQPDLLVAPASVLSDLAEKVGKGLQIKPIKIISVAEVLSNEDKQQIEKAFKQKVHQVYQATEGFLASSCSHGHLHLNEDIAIFEKKWLDKKSGRFSPIITDFRRESQPIVRYQLDDVLQIEPDPCRCGSIFTRIKSIEGRCDDILLLQNWQHEKQKVFPDFIRNCIIACDARIRNYKVEQTSLKKIKIALEPYDPVIIKNTELALTRLCATLQLQSPDFVFARYQPPLPGEKLRRVSRSFAIKQIAGGS